MDPKWKARISMLILLLILASFILTGIDFAG